MTTVNPQDYARSDVQVSPRLATNLTDETTMETAVSLSPLNFEEALKGLLMTREIQNNPEELADLERSREQVERGEVRWLDEDDNKGEGEPTA